MGAMDSKPGVMKSRLLSLLRRPLALSLLAIGQFPIVSMALLEGINQARCAVWQCQFDDDASMRAMTLVGVVLMVVYALLSLLMVLPLTLLLRHWFGKLVSSLLGASSFGLLVAWIFYLPAVDSFARFVSFGLWLSVPWFIAGAIACALWSHQSLPPVLINNADAGG